MDALVINGAIRDEIGLNYEIGAMGPYAHANTTIGRAWSLMAINLGNCGKVGTTYMGIVGNPMNLINIVIAENERDIPMAALFRSKRLQEGREHRQPVRRMGRSFRGKLEGQRLGKRDELSPRSSRTSSINQGVPVRACAVLSPPIANFVKNAGYKTVEDFEKYLMEAPAGQEPWFQPNAMEIIVTGGTNNNYYSIGGLMYLQSVEVDKWR